MISTPRQALATALSLVLLALTACKGDGDGASRPEPAAETTGFSLLGELNYRLLPEASGMTASRIAKNRLWLINDQGNVPALIALDTASMAMIRIPVSRARNRDWEDLAGFTRDGLDWLLIADVGDNQAVRSAVSLIFVREPVSLNIAYTDAAMNVALIYPDGPRDVESVAVDVTRDSIYLLSKRTDPPVLYRVGLGEAMAAAAAARPEPLLAERVGAVTSIPPPTAMELKLFPEFGRYRNQPTAMELSPNGRHIALLTYGQAYLINLAPEQDWLDAMNTPLNALSMPVLAQAETIAIDAAGHLYVSSERRSAPLLILDIGANDAN